jgi:type I restriction enzyme R subunit
VASPNFAFLAPHAAQLLRLATLAERLFVEDPSTTLVKLRQFGELMALQLAARAGRLQDPDEAQVDRLRRLQDEGLLPRSVADLLHQIRKAGNAAVHALDGDHQQALAHLKIAHRLAAWFHQTVADRAFRPEPFVPPPDPRVETAALQRELARLREEVEARRSAQEAAAAQAERERLSRLSAEERARLAEEERRLVEELAAEAEAGKAPALAQLRSLQDAAGGPDAPPVAALRASAEEAARELSLDEFETRRLIDAQLRAAGWEADTGALTHAGGARPERGADRAIAEWPTADGPADYVLFSGLTPVAVVEAKRLSVDVPASLTQAARYSRGYEVLAGEVPPEGGPWDGHRVPFLFATNGRRHLPQLPTASGIWFRDARRAENAGRALEDWYTPEGLRALLERDEAAAHAQLRATGFAYNFGLRDYQIRAIQAVEAGIEQGRRALLLAMATGTGKTKTCIALIYRLLAAKRFRRILFLVDRTALGEQAEGAFRDTRIVQMQPFADIFEVKAIGDTAPDPSTKVHVATVQAMVKRILYADDGTMPPVDQYDCVVVDECHRGYLLDREMGEAELRFRNEDDYRSRYKAVLDRFDAVRIGLTATPALHTTQIFGPPVFRYAYREAVIDGWLVDHDPPVQIHTELRKAGIHWVAGETITMLDRGTGGLSDHQLPDDLGFEVESFNRRVVTPAFNRAVAQALADHVDPALPGKTLVFAAADDHADILVDAIREAMRARYGTLEEAAVEKITGSVDKPSQRIRAFKNERLPRIVVTVDLLTTGIDVPEIVDLVFVRRVSSRILYEQMIGRATRLCPEIGKAAFRIFDAVGLYGAMQDVTAMRPVVANPDVGFGQLVEELAETVGRPAEAVDAVTTAPGVREPAAPFEPAPPEAPAGDDAARRAEKARYLIDQIVAKLQRRRRRYEGEGERASRFAELAGGLSPAQLADRLRTAGPEAAAAMMSGLTPLIGWLDRGGEVGPVRVPVSAHPDRVIGTTIGYGDGFGRPEDYLTAFEAFLRDRINEVPALAAVAQRPRDLTRAQLREIRLMLEEKGFRERDLRAAFRDARHVDVAAGIIGFIRQAAIGDPLVPYEARVDRALARILGERAWTPVQRQWLERIARQMKIEVVVDRESLDGGQFRAEGGGFDRLDRVFGGRLGDALGALADAVWEKAG